MSLTDEAKVDVLMREYQFLRDEILDSNKIKFQILSFGGTTLAIIFGAAATSIKNNLPELGQFLLFYLLPSFSITVLLVWLGEMEKIQRIANHQLKIELKINSILKEDLLSFETALRKKPLTMIYSYSAVVILFSFIAVSPGIFQDLISQ